MPKKLLFVVTSHDKLGETGRQTGWYLSEVAHPYEIFARAGIEMVFASPQGGEAPCDEGSIEAAKDDAVCTRFAAEKQGTTAGQTKPLKDVDAAAGFDAVFFAGGLGAMWDFPDDADVRRIVRAVWDAGGVVSAVCHGTSALVNVALDGGAPLLRGRGATAYSTAEESAIKCKDVVPFLLEERVAAAGANYTKAGAFQPHVVVDGKLVTGQNPPSAAPCAEAVVRLLGEGFALHAEDLSALPRKELLRLLDEEDRRRADVSKQLQKAKSTQRKEDLRGAERKKFSASEEAQIRKAFDAFDKDRSGKIDLQELTSVSKELGCDMSDAEIQEAMTELDKNKDGTLDWGEFLVWWGDDKKRGGNKGVKLRLMRTRLRARLLKEELEGRMDRTARVRTDDAPRPQTFSSASTIGNVDDNFEPGSSVEVVVLPSAPAEFEAEVKKLLPDDVKFEGGGEDEDGDQVQPIRVVVVADIALRASATEQDVDDAMEVFKPVLSQLPAEFGSIHVEKSAGPPLGVGVKMLIRLPKDDDNLLKLVGKFLAASGRDAEGSMAEVFSIWSLLVQVGCNLGDAARLDNKEPVIDLLSKARVAAHAQMSSHAMDLLEGTAFRVLMDEGGSDWDVYQKPVRGCFAARLFDNVEVENSWECPADAVTAVAKGLADFPVSYATRKGEMTPEIAEESLRLQQYFKNKLHRMFKAGAPVGGVYAMMMFFPFQEEMIVALAQAFAKVGEGVTSVHLMHPMFSAKVSLTGMLLAKHFPTDLDEDDLRAALEQGMQPMKKFMGEADSDDDDEDKPTFPKISQLLCEADDAGDLFAIAFRESLPAHMVLGKKEMLEAMFKWADKDEDGLLNWDEMTWFVKTTEGEMDEEAFKELCKDLGADSKAGLNPWHFAAVYDKAPEEERKAAIQEHYKKVEEHMAVGAETQPEGGEPKGPDS